MCTSTSSTYQEFALNSPLISSVSPLSPIGFNKDRQISSTNPITVSKSGSVQSTVFFPAFYQVMELNLVTTQPTTIFNARIGDDKTMLDASLVSSTAGSYEYVIDVPTALMQPTNKITVVVFAPKTTNITAFTIKACTGTDLSLTKGTLVIEEGNQVVLIVPFP